MNFRLEEEERFPHLILKDDPKASTSDSLNIFIVDFDGQRFTGSDGIDAFTILAKQFHSTQHRTQARFPSQSEQGRL